MVSPAQKRFSKALMDGVEKLTEEEASIFVRKFAFDALAGVIEKSPVDTGRFKGNWRVGINSPDRSTVTTAVADKTPVGSPGTSSPTFARVSGKIARAKAGSTIILSNNLPYAAALEDGHSSQAPGTHAIVGRTMEELLASFQ